MAQISNDILKMVTDYYQQKIGKKPDAEKQEIFRKSLASGIKANDILNAIDFAISRYGMNTQPERFYWDTIYKDMKDAYKLLKKEGLLE